MKKFALISLIFIGAFFRLYNLNWGAPFYFHPDERNIASAVTRINFPDQMNPHFFAYGSLPIYTIYFTGVLLNFLSNYTLSPITYTLSFEQAVIISRIYSSIFSIAIIPLLYLTGKKLKNKEAGVISAVLATFGVGFIQFAHFGTVEMWNTFLGLLLFYLCIIAISKFRLAVIVLLSLIFGLLCSTKISNVVLLPLPVLSIFLSSFKINSSEHRSIMQLANAIIIFTVLVLATYLITNPFTYLSFEEFKNSIKYESDVALGTLPVFYTGEFFGTIPVIFQFQKIYPFIINPILTIFFIPAFFYILYAAIKKKSINYLLLATCYVLLFLPNAFLFTKWTRYIVPTLPFVYLIIAISISNITHRHAGLASISYRRWRFWMRSCFTYQNDVKILNQTIQTSSKYLVLGLLIIPSIFFALSYFLTAFVQEDTRIAAAKWAKENMKTDVKVISEVYDLGITPFNDSFHYSNITLFNFYDLDNNTPDATLERLNEILDKGDYIILPSQRIFKPRLQNPQKFPTGNSFYQKLFTENIGFVKIYQTPCDIWCKITYLNDPIFSFEQTANVFERPVVMIFEKH